MYARATFALGIGLAGLLAGGCANDSGAQLSAPQHLGADLQNMGGARYDALHGDAAAQIIEPTSSSKVISAIVFERVTGLPAYFDGSKLSK
jgi:hypothetical protein